MTSTSLKGKYSNYHYCIVRDCKSTSIKTPEKVWIKVPNEKNKRNTWLKLAKRDPNSLSIQTQIYFCEDHFDMEKDTVNYLKYKMGFSKKITVADDAVPTKFNCQEDHKKRLSDSGPSREEFPKRKRIDLVTQRLLSQNATATRSESLPKDNVIVQITLPEELPKTQDKETFTDVTVQKTV